MRRRVKADSFEKFNHVLFCILLWCECLTVNVLKHVSAVLTQKVTIKTPPHSVFWVIRAHWTRLPLHSVTCEGQMWNIPESECSEMIQRSWCVKAAPQSRYLLYTENLSSQCLQTSQFSKPGLYQYICTAIHHSEVTVTWDSGRYIGLWWVVRENGISLPHVNHLEWSQSQTEDETEWKEFLIQSFWLQVNL